MKKGLTLLMEILIAISGRSRGSLFVYSLGMGECRQLQTSMESQFFQNVVDVALDRINGNIEFTGDLFIAFPGGYMADYLLLPAGQSDGRHQLIHFAALKRVLHDLRKKRFGHQGGEPWLPSPPI